MRGFLAMLFLTGSLAFCTGCASMCDSSFDCDYHAFGGMRDRYDRTNGRVSSVFDPASAAASVLPPKPALPFYEPRKSFTDDEDVEADADSADDADDDSEFGDKLLKQLDDMEDLPNIKDDASSDAEI